MNLKQRKKKMKKRKYINPNRPKPIHNWEELEAVKNESKTHFIEITDDYCFYVRKINGDGYLGGDDHYLSTHTFYGSQYKEMSKLLRRCGFNIKLISWD